LFQISDLPFNEPTDWNRCSQRVVRPLARWGTLAGPGVLGVAASGAKLTSRKPSKSTGMRRLAPHVSKW